MERSLIAYESPQDVETSTGEGEDRSLVALSLGSLTVVEDL